MKLTIPELSLVALIGASGSGKTMFAKKHFLPTEVISSDYCRALVSDGEASEATAPAFEILHFIASKRLRFGKLAVIDATNVKKEDRAFLVNVARDNDCLPVAIVLNMGEKLCLERNAARTDRRLPERAISLQSRNLRQSVKKLGKEGFRYIYILNTPEEADAVEIVRQPLWNDRRSEHGPFDIIGDIHGCFDELMGLLKKLGYTVEERERRYTLRHAEGRKALFLGDFADRGEKNAETLRFVMDTCEEGSALAVCGNHDAKLLSWLNGKNVHISHGLDKTISEIEEKPKEFSERLKTFLSGLVGHYVLDGGRLVAAHAGMKEAYQGRASRRVREFGLYGDTTGETDEYGLPVRLDWAGEYRGKALVVYGHTPLEEASVINNTACIDTGCVYGGKLSAYRYPEKEIISVPAAAVYYESVRPFLENKTPAASNNDDLPDISDVLGKRIINTRLTKNIPIFEENSAAALEIMSRFAVNPRWLIYLPPTMSPCETSQSADYLEHPLEALSYFSSRGVGKVVCEEKHMGSRAVVIVCQNEEIAAHRFGVNDGTFGICYTRTGRRFFDSAPLEVEFLERIRSRLFSTGFFEDFNTGWVALDCELLPWSAKARQLLKQQYAPAAAAGIRFLHAAEDALRLSLKRSYSSAEVDASVSGQPLDLAALLKYFEERSVALEKYRDAYRIYCWEVDGLSGIKLAPFHILAAENAVYADKSHVWHMDNISKYLAEKDKMIISTPYITVDTTNEADIVRAADWWLELTERGGEGMVVKPFNFIAEGYKGLLQPAVKCRGREYLRIIYGPEYLLEGNLPRLKSRSLSHKRNLALKEFSLGIEALERFVRKEGFHRVHECVFAVLALESEPVDPRL